MYRVSASGLLGQQPAYSDFRNHSILYKVPPYQSFPQGFPALRAVAAKNVRMLVFMSYIIMESFNICINNSSISDFCVGEW